MGQVEMLEQEVERLDAKAFAEFRDWFVEYDHARWDRQIESDAGTGKLDALIDEARAGHQSGKSSPL